MADPKPPTAPAPANAPAVKVLGHLTASGELILTAAASSGRPAPIMRGLSFGARVGRRVALTAKAAALPTCNPSALVSLYAAARADSREASRRCLRQARP